MDRASYLKKLERITDLPTLPVIAMEVNKLLQDDNVTIEKLKNTLEKDQAIVSKMLRLVNSAFFGLRSKVKSVSESIVILGFNSVRNLVVSVSVLKAFSNKEELKGFDLSLFWKHSIAVAMIAKRLSENSGECLPDESFLAGLLHDIGKIVQYKYFPDMFAAIWSMKMAEKITYHEAEKRNNVYGHGLTGGYLAKRWQLPGELIFAIENHHRLSKNDRQDHLALIINAADTIVNSYVGEEKETIYLDMLDEKTIKVFGKSIAEINQWLPDIAQEIKDAWAFFLE